MYNLLLSNTPQAAQNAQSAVDAFLAMIGMSFLLSILLPILAFLFVLTVKILLGVLTQSIAGKKGYNRFGFFWYGFFFFPIAVGVAILAPPLNKSGLARTTASQQDEDELAKYKEMYEAGTLSWTQYCQKKEEIERRAYYK
jgi:hypothetical protein